MYSQSINKLSLHMLKKKKKNTSINKQNKTKIKTVLGLNRSPTIRICKTKPWQTVSSLQSGFFSPPANLSLVFDSCKSKVGAVECTFGTVCSCKHAHCSDNILKLTISYCGSDQQSYRTCSRIDRRQGVKPERLQNCRQSQQG